ncbi:Uma2 family endonuclease [Streptomyces sp. LP05-1]|uniref:Uma2 family endonuclease n=1 Tax=Streptomyces pyxinae TaxID=2970734 RepID=A0ABT2CPR3_9ACTN|nr:Uma2 family endonuclease [Streptomyces sp. LP05-1]MCS0639427.1 Uma2 family endonuclease [Streptomyces sp. LP05-1]
MSSPRASGVPGPGPEAPGVPGPAYGERTPSRLARFEDAFPGFRPQIVAGSYLLTPVKPHDGATVHRLWGALAGQLPDDWGLAGDIAVPFDAENEFCPDLAVLPETEAAKDLIAYPPELLALVAEVVSPGTAHTDYEVKDRAHARRGIPHYLVLDPYRARCRVLWNPGADGYLGRETVPYGSVVTVEGGGSRVPGAAGLGRLTVDTTGFPVDPSARRAAGRDGPGAPRAPWSVGGAG